MTLLNDFLAKGQITKEDLKTFLILLNPVAPHITEEIWERFNFADHIYQQKWPEYDEEKTKDDVINLPVQVNGKLRANIEISIDEEEESIFNKAIANESIKKHIEGKDIIKKIYVNGKIYNIVVK